MCDYEYLFVVLNNTIAMCRKDETGYCVVPIEGEPFVDFMDKKKYWSSWCESTNCDPETCLVDFVFLSNPLVEVDEISNMLAAVGFKQVEKTSWSLDAIHDALSSFKFGRPPVICAPKSVNTETKGILHLYLARLGNTEDYLGTLPTIPEPVGIPPLRTDEERDEEVSVAELEPDDFIAYCKQRCMENLRRCNER